MTTPPPYPQDPGGYSSLPPYASGGYEQPPRNGLSIAALVLGICSLVLFFLAPFVAVAAILAIIFGIIGIVRANRHPQGRKGMAVAGLVLGVIGLIVSIILTILAYQLRERCEEKIGHTPNTDELQQCIEDGV